MIYGPVENDNITHIHLYDLKQMSIVFKSAGANQKERHQNAVLDEKRRETHQRTNIVDHGVISRSPSKSQPKTESVVPNHLIPVTALTLSADSAWNKPLKIKTEVEVKQEAKSLPLSQPTDSVRNNE